jgi:CheY-like chemotaxis protein
LGREAPFDLRGLSVLIVEDNADVRDVLAAMFDCCGAVVTPASSARTALAWLDVHQPDLIISDLGMPGEDGLWFIRQVRGLSSPVSTIPAVALTGFDDLRSEAEAAGFNVSSSNRSNCSRSLKYSNVSDSRLAKQQLSKSTEARPKPVAHHPVEYGSGRACEPTRLKKDGP